MRGGRLVRQRGSGLWLPDERERSAFGRARKDEQGYWLRSDGSRLPPIAGAQGPALDQPLGHGSYNGITNQFACLAAVPSSELVIGAGGAAGTATAGTTITDSAGNAYTRCVENTVGSVAQISASNIATALTTSSTMSYSVLATNGVVAGGSFTGCKAGAAALSYATGVNHGVAGGPASVASGSVAAGDLVVLMVAAVGGAAVGTPAGWSVVESAGGLGMFWRVASATGALNPSCTLSSGATWGAAIAAFPAAGQGDFFPLM